VNTDAALSGEDFYSRAMERIRRMMVVLGIAGVITSGTYLGWRVALGLTLGSAIGFLNFYWLQKVVNGIGELTVRSGAPVSTAGVVSRFLLRYILMAAAAFVILRVSRESLYGLFAGLLLPVTAILCEGAYEAYNALLRGI
jgi:hypothetical protein